MTNPEKNVPLSRYTHYEIGGIAREAYFPEDCGELLGILENLHSSRTPYFLLGGGTNVLVGDGYWDGAVVITTRMTGYETRDDGLTCGAGLPSSCAAEIALEQGKTGLEFLYMLPGTVGGAVAGNARFENTDIAEVVTAVRAAHPEKGIRTFDAEEMEFGYKRNKIVQEGWYICEVSLAWEDGDADSIRAHMEAIDRFRTGHHHFEHPCCGCVFKNDHERNIQAGRLIDSLGLKGMRVGGAEVAPFHANFIVNKGGATAADVLELIERIEKTVFEKTGITLEREIRILGNFERAR